MTKNLTIHIFKQKPIEGRHPTKKGLKRIRFGSYRNTIDLRNQKFGRLLVIDAKGHTKSRSVIWDCLCDCGNKKLVDGAELRRGGTQSCGCLQKELVSWRSSYDKGISFINYKFSEYIRKSKKRDLKFELNKEQFTDLIFSNCYYCNDEPELRSKPHNLKYNIPLNGIDRIDNNLGYTIYNCVTCCATCNFIKNSISQEELFDKVKKIYINHLKDKF